MFGFAGAEDFENEVQRRNMEFTSARHEMFEALKSLNGAQARAIDVMLTAIVHSGEDGPRLASWWSGFFSSLLEKHGICPACDKDHNEELRNVVESEP